MKRSSSSSTSTRRTPTRGLRTSSWRRTVSIVSFPLVLVLFLTALGLQTTVSWLPTLLSSSVLLLLPPAAESAGAAAVAAVSPILFVTPFVEVSSKFPSKGGCYHYATTSTPKIPTRSIVSLALSLDGSGSGSGSTSGAIAIADEIETTTIETAHNTTYPQDCHQHPNRHNDQKWEAMYTLLEQYYQREGHCAVPRHYQIMRTTETIPTEAIHTATTTTTTTTAATATATSTTPTNQTTSRTTKSVKLGTWCNRQKQLHTQGKLSAQRVQKLNQVGIVWSRTSSQKWEQMYQYLVQYTQEQEQLAQQQQHPQHNAQHSPKQPTTTAHTNPIPNPNPTTSIRWVSVPQQYQIIPNRTTTPSTTSRPPQQVIQLGRWYDRQRTLLKHNKLSPAKQKKLQALHCSCSVPHPQWTSSSTTTTSTRKDGWETMYTCLLEYKEKYGHIHVPNKYQHTYTYTYDNTTTNEHENENEQETTGTDLPTVITVTKNLGTWLATQRQTLHHRRQPQTYNDHDATTNSTATNNTNTTAATSDGDVAVVSDIRQQYRKEKLNELGMVWDVNKHKWEYMYTLLKLYLRQQRQQQTDGNNTNDDKIYVDNDVEDREKEGCSIINTIPTTYEAIIIRNTGADNDNIDSNTTTTDTDSINCSSGSSSSSSSGSSGSSGEENAIIVDGNTIDIGNDDTNGSNNISNVVKLGIWVHYQRQRYKLGKLSKQRQQDLELLGMKWDYYRQKKYDDKNKTTTTRTTTRTQKKGKKMTTRTNTVTTAAAPTTGTSIASEGVTPTKFTRQKQKWDTMFELLLRYKQQTGHCRVPVHYQFDVDDMCTDNSDIDIADANKRGTMQKNTKVGTKTKKNLGLWVYTQRAMKTKGALDYKREQQLSSIDFIWNIVSYNWEIMYKYLVRYKNLYGHCVVPATYSISSSYTTINSDVNNLDDANSGDDNDDATSSNKSNRDDKTNLHIMNTTPTTINLGAWLLRQRQLKKENKLNHNYEQRLEELGVVWDSVRAQNWQRMFRIFEHYSKKKGTCHVPRTYYCYTKDDDTLEEESDNDDCATTSTRPTTKINLGTWVNQQHQKYQRGTLHPLYQSRLERLGVIWKETTTTKNKKKRQNKHKNNNNNDENDVFDVDYDFDDGIPLNAFDGMDDLFGDSW